MLIWEKKQNFPFKKNGLFRSLFFLRKIFFLETKNFVFNLKKIFFSFFFLIIFLGPTFLCLDFFWKKQNNKQKGKIFFSKKNKFFCFPKKYFSQQKKSSKLFVSWKQIFLVLPPRDNHYSADADPFPKIRRYLTLFLFFFWRNVFLRMMTNLNKV